MTSDGRALLIYVIPYQNSRQCPFVFKHINQLSVRPGIQSLVQSVSIVNALTDPVKVTNGYLLHAPPYAFRNKMGGGYVQ
jgi:hypothetical protein